MVDNEIFITIPNIRVKIIVIKIEHVVNRKTQDHVHDWNCFAVNQQQKQLAKKVLTTN